MSWTRGGNGGQGPLGPTAPDRQIPPPPGSQPAGTDSFAVHPWVPSAGQGLIPLIVAPPAHLVIQMIRRVRDRPQVPVYAA